MMRRTPAGEHLGPISRNNCFSCKHALTIFKYTVTTIDYYCYWEWQAKGSRVVNGIIGGANLLFCYCIAFKEHTKVDGEVMETATQEVRLVVFVLRLRQQWNWFWKGNHFFLFFFPLSREGEVTTQQRAVYENVEQPKNKEYESLSEATQYANLEVSPYEKLPKEEWRSLC